MHFYLTHTHQGHSNRINAVTAVPDGSLLISASQDHTVKVWEALGDTPRFVMDDHQAPVNAVTAFYRSYFVVSGGDDSRLIVWNAQSGERVRAMHGHTDAITALTVTPDGNHIISGGRDQTLRIWDTLTGALRHTCSGHASAIHTLAITPDSRYAIAGETGSAERAYTLRVWEIATGADVRMFEEHHAGVNQMQFMANGTLLLTGSPDGDLKIWDWQRGTVRRTIETHLGSMVMTMLPDERHIIAGTQKPVLTLWDLTLAEQRAKLDEPSDWVSALAYIPNSQQLIVGCHDGTLNIYHLQER